MYSDPGRELSYMHLKRERRWHTAFDTTHSVNQQKASNVPNYLDKAEGHIQLVYKMKLKDLLGIASKDFQDMLILI